MLNLTAQKENDLLTMELAGRLDTVTAPDLQNAYRPSDHPQVPDRRAPDEKRGADRHGGVGNYRIRRYPDY